MNKDNRNVIRYYSHTSTAFRHVFLFYFIFSLCDTHLDALYNKDWEQTSREWRNPEETRDGMQRISIVVLMILVHSTIVSDVLQCTTIAYM
jgi:hypothetical protein